MRRSISHLLALWALLFALQPSLGSEVLHEKRSQYHYISVIESGTIRTLTFRRKGYDRNQSSMDMSDPFRPCLPYYPLMFSGYLFVPKPRHILIVGLGAGVLSRWSAHYFPEAIVDSIELDPEVVAVAEKFFGFETGGRQRVFIRDARVQIKSFRRQQANYDVIMLDAFRGGYVPAHLMTREFFEECRSILSDDGAIVLNLKPGWVIYRYQRRTVASVFAEQYPFGGASGSEIVVALPRKKKIPKETLLATANRLQEERKFSFRLDDVVAQFDMGPGFSANGPIFTDDHVPANILRQQLDDPYGIKNLPKPPFARVAAWLREYRAVIVSFALALIIFACVLRKIQRDRAAKSPPPG